MTVIHWRWWQLQFLRHFRQASVPFWHSLCADTSKLMINSSFCARFHFQTQRSISISYQQSIAVSFFGRRLFSNGVFPHFARIKLPGSDISEFNCSNLIFVIVSAFSAIRKALIIEKIINQILNIQFIDNLK